MMAVLETKMDSLLRQIEKVCDVTSPKSTRHAAFAELVNEYYEVAFYWASTRLDDPMLAQDAVQEGFVVAYQQLHALRAPKAFPGWLRQIVLSQCSRLTRNRELLTSNIEYSANIAAGDASPDQSIEDTELKNRVLQAIDALPEKEQMVTRLYYLYGYSQKEISRLLAVPVTTVKKRLQYARGNLRGLLATVFDSLYPSEPQPRLEPIPIRIRQRSYQPPRQDSW